MKQICAAIIFFLCLVFNVSAQVDKASLTGLIQDVTGAVIAGARVVALSKATNISLEATSGEDGYYNFANLRPGVYEITVEQQGFKRDPQRVTTVSWSASPARFRSDGWAGFRGCYSHE